MEATLVHPRASFSSPFPPFRGIDIGTPERPCPALSRTVGVHRAPLFLLKEYTILILLLDEAYNPTPHATRVAVTKRGLREIEAPSKGTDFMICDANGAGKATTTAPTALAPKTQPFFVPEVVTHEIAHPARLRLTLFLERQPLDKARYSIWPCK
jgi:hypothetical protein